MQDDAGAAAAAEAILAHMEYALAHRLGDAPGRPEQLTVVLDSHGAPTLQVGLGLTWAAPPACLPLHVDLFAAYKDAPSALAWDPVLVKDRALHILSAAQLPIRQPEQLLG